MQYYETIFDIDSVKKCISDISLNGEDQEIYFNKVKENKINNFADKTNETFDNVINEICNIIETSDNIYNLRKISEALNRLNEISKRVYFTEMEFMNTI